LKRIRRLAVALEVPFSRQDLVRTARALRLKLPKNLGDIVYALRYRVALPESIRATQPEGSEWIIEGAGRAEFAFLYVGVDRFGSQFVIPVQAKGGADQLSPVQTKQDIACCRTRFPQLLCRAVSAQFMADDLIAIFELRLVEDQIKVVDEKHCRLVPADAITSDDLRSYAAAGVKDRSVH